MKLQKPFFYGLILCSGLLLFPRVGMANPAASDSNPSSDGGKNDSLKDTEKGKPDATKIESSVNTITADLTDDPQTLGNLNKELGKLAKKANQLDDGKEKTDILALIAKRSGEIADKATQVRSKQDTQLLSELNQRKLNRGNPQNKGDGDADGDGDGDGKKGKGAGAGGAGEGGDDKQDKQAGGGGAGGGGGGGGATPPPQMAKAMEPGKIDMTTPDYSKGNPTADMMYPKDPSGDILKDIKKQLASSPSYTHKQLNIGELPNLSDGSYAAKAIPMQAAASPDMPMENRVVSNAPSNSKQTRLLNSATSGGYKATGITTNYVGKALQGQALTLDMKPSNSGTVGKVGVQEQRSLASIAPEKQVFDNYGADANYSTTIQPSNTSFVSVDGQASGGGHKGK